MLLAVLSNIILLLIVGSLLLYIFDFEGALNITYDLFQFTFSHFNFPWLILIALLLFRKELKKLINSTSKITYGENSIQFDTTEFRKNLATIEKNYRYIKTKNPPSMGGSMGPDTDPSSIPPIFLIYNDNTLSNYYNHFGSLATVEKLYIGYRKVCESYYNLESSNSVSIKNKIQKNNRENEIELYEAIEIFYFESFYYKTIDYNDAENLWRFEDVEKYRNLVKAGISEFYFDMFSTESVEVNSE